MVKQETVEIPVSHTCSEVPVVGLLMPRGSDGHLGPDSCCITITITTTIIIIIIIIIITIWEMSHCEG